MKADGDNDPSLPIEGLRESILDALRSGAGMVDSVARAGRVCVALLPIDGVSISLMSGASLGEVVSASDEIIRVVESLQFTLGEGPCFEAVDLGRPVLVPDMAAEIGAAWPVLATEVARLQVGAFYAFPLQSGAIRVGAMGMYRRRPGWLSSSELSSILQIVDIMTLALLGLAVAENDADVGYAWLEDLPHHRDVVHQATGMMIAGHGISAAVALVRLRGHAFATGRLVEDVARDITTRRLLINDIET